MTEDFHLATCLVYERTYDADSCCLASAIGTQQCIKIARFDSEIDALQCLIAVGIDLGEISY